MAAEDQPNPMEEFLRQFGITPGPDGTFDHPVTRGEGVEAGLHEVLFHLGDFYAGTKDPPPRFLEVVPFRFRVFDPALHYHLPIKFTPWGFSLYRGA